jgi:arabinofuranosyltransferase
MIRSQAQIGPRYVGCKTGHGHDTRNSGDSGYTANIMAVVVPGNWSFRTLRLVSALGALSLLYVGTAHLTGAGIVDDAYIFLRYARNIWLGVGPVFNAGEWVEGYTSPSWLALLTILWPAARSPVSLAVGMSALVGFLIVLAVACHTERSSRGASLIGAAFLASNAPFVYWAWSGMDTALFTAFLTATVLVGEHDRSQGRLLLRTGVLLALTALTRLEALVLVVPLGIGLCLGTLSWQRRGVLLLSLGLPVALIVGLHTIWRFSEYGAWLPNTFAAKVGVPVVLRLEAGLRYGLWTALAASPMLVALALSWRELRRCEKRAVGVPLSVIATWSAYVVWVGGDHFALFRFFVPILGLCAVVLSRVAWMFACRSRAALPFAAILVVGSNCVPLATPELAAARGEVQETAAWAKTGQWCKESLEPGLVATLAIGAVPFYCGHPTLDLLGLVDSHIAQHGQVFPDAAVGHQKHDTEYVLGRKPRYIFFTSSGQFNAPLFRDVESRLRLSTRTSQALKELVVHPETLATYEYRAQRLSDGTWVELMEFRGTAGQPAPPTSRSPSPF